jgi:hypothetical protein
VARATRWLINGLIGLLILFATVQGVPLKMNAAINRVRWVADLAGIGHQEWNMFAPVPDHQNHRLSAEIMSSFEHVAGQWTMPNWREYPPTRRFWMHRWSEYYDHVWANHNTVCWPALAQHALRSAKYSQAADDEPPRQVKLMVETVTFPRPSGDRWPPPVPPHTYDDKWILWIEQLHLGGSESETDNLP